MKFTIKSFVLRVLLEKASMVLVTSGKDVSQLLKGFQIEATEDRLRVMSTDLSMAVIAESELVVVERVGQYIFPGQKLVEIAKEAEDTEGTIEIVEDQATVQFGKASWTFHLLQGDYPELPTREGAVFTQVNREGLVDALERVYLALSGDSVRPDMMVIQVAENKIQAADGPRYHAVSFTSDLEIDIPGGAVPYLIRQLQKSEEDSVSVADTDQALLFLIKEDLFVVTKSAVEPPDFSVYVNATRSHDLELSFDRRDFESAIRRVRINADPDTAQIFLRLSPDAGQMLAKDKFGNLAMHDLDVYWKSDDKLVSVNWKYLLDVLKATRKGSVSCLLGADGTSRRSVLLFKEDDFTAVLSQLRVSADDAAQVLNGL